MSQKMFPIFLVAMLASTICCTPTSTTETPPKAKRQSGDPMNAMLAPVKPLINTILTFQLNTINGLTASVTNFCAIPANLLPPMKPQIDNFCNFFTQQVFGQLRSIVQNIQKRLVENGAAPAPDTDATAALFAQTKRFLQPPEPTKCFGSQCFNQ